MKLVYSLAVGFLLAASPALAELRCESVNGKVTSSRKMSSFVYACEEQTYRGLLCYTGDRAQAMRELIDLNGTRIFEGYFAVEQVKASGANEISYIIRDTVDQAVASENLIGRCTR